MVGDREEGLECRRDIQAVRETIGHQRDAGKSGSTIPVSPVTSMQTNVYIPRKQTHKNISKYLTTQILHIQLITQKKCSAFFNESGMSPLAPRRALSLTQRTSKTLEEMRQSILRSHSVSKDKGTLDVQMFSANTTSEHGAQVSQ